MRVQLNEIDDIDILVFVKRRVTGVIVSTHRQLAHASLTLVNCRTSTAREQG